MDHRWLKHNTKEEVLGYRNALDTLKGILLSDFLKKEAVRDYSPGWEFKQVAANEYNAVLTDIVKLITIEKE
jgi:hypothetical protein